MTPDVKRATPALAAPAFLRVGALAGAAVGAVAGLADGLSALPLAGRLPFPVGVMGLLGAALGALGALLLLGRPRARADVPAALAAVAALAAFPLLAAALGLLANRVLLRGTHFLSPASLAADAAALLAAALLALGLERLARRALRAAATTRPPSPAVAGVALAVLAAAATLPVLRGPAAPADPGLPPIVVVSIDTLRPDRLSAGGDPRGTSPAVDRLLRQGLQFADAITVSPGSAGGHAALLTSRYPVSSGVFANFSVMDTSVVTLAEILREEGYRTGGFVTNTFLGRRFRFDQGFDTYVESGVVERLEERGPAALLRSLALVQIIDRARVRLAPGYDPSFETALRWLRESTAPTFLFVHLMDVHSPYAPPHPYGPRFGADPDAGRPGPARRNRFGWRPSEPAYAAEIRFADAKVRRLVRALEERGLLDDAVLVLTSDHGENLDDHDPPFSHGATMYDATVRILAGVRAPAFGLRRGVEAAPFENVDVLPTIAALRDRPPHPAWEGRPFHPAAPAPREPSWVQLDRDFAARTPAVKLILREDGTRTRFDLLADPGETRPATPEPDETAAAEAALAAWMAARATRLYLEDARAIAPAELPEDVVEKLKALGYVE